MTTDLSSLPVGAREGQRSFARPAALIGWLYGRRSNPSAYRRLIALLAGVSLLLFVPSLAVAGVPPKQWAMFVGASAASALAVLPAFLLAGRSMPVAIAWAGVNAVVVALLSALFADFYATGPLAIALLVVAHAAVHGLPAGLAAAVLGAISLALTSGSATVAASLINGLYAGVFLAGAALIPWTTSELARRRLLDDHAAIERELRQQAFSDPLTGLANRLLLRERLEHAIERRPARRGELAVLFIDLNGFKAVNDRFGHAIGDHVLRSIAERLRAALRPADTVARHGGDEFVVLLEDLSDARQAERMAGRVQAALESGLEVDGELIRVDGSIGVAVWCEGQDAEALLDAADAAMYAAKQAEAAQHGAHLSVVS